MLASSMCFTRDKGQSVSNDSVTDWHYNQTNIHMHAYVQCTLPGTWKNTEIGIRWGKGTVRVDYSISERDRFEV